MLTKNLITLIIISSLSACSDESTQEVKKIFDDNDITLPEGNLDKDIDIDVDVDVDTDADIDTDTDTNVDFDVTPDTDTDTDTDDTHWLQDVAACFEETKEQYTFMSAVDDGKHLADLGPENVIDEDFDSQSRWSSEGLGKEIVLDFGEIKRVGTLQLLWHEGQSKIPSYHIEISDDNTSWTRLTSDRNAVFDSDNNFEAVDLLAFNYGLSIDTQYIKLIGQGNTSGDNLNSLIEAQAFRCGTTVPILPSHTLLNPCDELGQISYNNTCAPYTEVFEVEHGELAEGAYLVNSTPIEMSFDALAAREVTPNGNGWRHELKIKSSGDYRVGMTEVYELFKAKITIDLDEGAKTIVAQHHAADTETITKLYIADLDEEGFESAPDGSLANSIAGDGIFDVYIRLARPDGSGETKHLLTTIKTGESFNFEEENDHGVITVKINGTAIDSITVADSSASYFKFGNYQQAQNPETGDKLASGDTNGDWAEFYAKYFSTSKITFTDMSYIRTVD